MKLKLCPFCGEQHKVEEGTDFHWGKCFVIDCHGTTLFIVYDDHNVPAMINHYNARPIEDKLQEENARLQEALHKINGYIESYVNGIEIGETGDKHYVYPSDEETYTGIGETIKIALNISRETE